MSADVECAVCSESAIHKCSRCSNVRYCSKQCQKKDWHTHKHQCNSKKLPSQVTNSMAPQGMEDISSLPQSAAVLDQGSCGNCEATTKTKCANCHKVYYCKRLCQRKHWHQHKPYCHPYEIQVDDTLGRYMVATRSLKPGDIILKEEPLVLGPLEPSVYMCLGCYRSIDASYRCHKCSWPLCGPQCEETSDHQPECELSRSVENTVADLGKEAYACIIPIRCMTLRNNEDKYHKFLNLEDHNEDRERNEKKMLFAKLVYNIIIKKLNVKYKSYDKTDSLQTLVNHALGIIDVNGFEIISGSTDIMGIFCDAAMMEHSCTPNTKLNFNSSHHIIVKAAGDIAEGEHISITYTKVLQGTVSRRKELLKNKYFLCSCKRCADPTEFDTYFSALKCSDCLPGFQLPSNSLDMKSNWICNNCSNTISSSIAAKITSEIGEEAEQAMLIPEEDSLEKLVDKLSNRVHCNHFHLVLVKHTLMQLYGKASTSRKHDILKKKEKICQEILGVFSSLDPSNAKVALFSGVTLFEYHDIVMMRAQKLASVEYPDEKKIEDCISLAKNLLQKCIKVLQSEPDDCQEGKFKVIVQKKLTEICLLTAKNVK